MTLVRQITSALITLSLAGYAGHAAASVSHIEAFGDSLSDTGNLFSLTAPTFFGGIPAAPYYNGRFSNGLLAVENMALQLGVNVTSHAFGGAQTGPANQAGAFLYDTGVSSQIGKYTAQLHGQPPPTDTLFFLWAGPNDFYTGNNMLNPVVPQFSATNMVYDIHNLFNAGARNFFVPLMPDLSVTPDALSSTDAYRTAARNQSQAFNSLLSAGIQNLRQTLPGLNVTIFDTPAFMNTNLPLLRDQGFNTTSACYDEQSNQVCQDADKYLFWDKVHPTAAIDRMLGSAFATAVGATSVESTLAVVPEPGMGWLMLMGLITVGVMRVGRTRSGALGI